MRRPASGDVRDASPDVTTLLHLVGRHLTAVEDVAGLADVLDLLVEQLGANGGLLMTLATPQSEPLRFLVGDGQVEPALEAVVERVRDTRQVVLTSQRELAQLWPAVPGLEYVSVALGIPIQGYSGNLTAILAISHPQAVGLDESNAAWLTALAYQISMALRQARLANEVRRRAYELSVLDEIGQAFASLDLEPLLRLILKRISRTLWVNRSALFMLDEEHGELILGAVDYPGSSDAVLGLRVPLTQRPHIVDAIRARQPIEVRDIYADPRWSDFWERAQRMGLEASLAVPLIVQGRAMGAISLDRTTARPPFTPDEVSLCQIIANQAASAIENARLYGETSRYAEESRLRVIELDRRAERLALLNRVSTTLGTSLEIAQIAPTIVAEIAQALHVRQSGLIVLQPDSLRGQLIAVYPAPDSADSLPVAIGLQDPSYVDLLLQADAPMLIADVQTHPLLGSVWPLLDTRAVGSLLIVPLTVAGRVQGIIGLDATDRDEPFSTDDLELAMTIGNQVAFALANTQLYEATQHRAAENARLYQEAQRRADQLRLINEVSNEIGSILDIDLLLWSVVRLIRETLDCYHVAIALVEGDELAFRADVGYLYEDSPLMGTRVHWAKEEGITGWVAKHAEPLLVSDVTAEPRYVAVPGLADTRSEVAVPLKLGDQVIGILDVQSNQAGGFDESDLSLLQSLAAQVAVAVENARLFSEVHRERAKLQAILDGAGDVVIVTDNDGRVVLMNRVAEKAFQVLASQARGCPLGDCVTNPGVRELWQTSLLAASYPLVSEIKLADGRTLYASLTSVPQVGLVAVMQDISHLKELDRMKSEFVSTVSHDLRSPLQAVRINLEVLPKMGALTPDQREAIASSIRVLDRVTSLVRDLLDLGRIEAGMGMERTSCSLTRIIAEALEGMQPRARLAGLNLTSRIPGDLPDVEGSPNRLAQVVANLVDNAIKYTLPEGQICVVAESREDEVRVEVQDTGLGIPAEAQARLFERFYRVPGARYQRTEGSGLGLAIVKSIIEAHGGRVWVESSTDENRHGTTFGFAIPVR